MRQTSARARAVACLAVLLCSVPAARPIPGSVTGQLSLLERPGAAQRRDLATAVIYLQSLERSDEADAGDVAAEATIAMRGREFLPHIAVVRRGGTVAFPNQDPFSHNVFSNTDPVRFDLGLYRRGSTRVATFTDPGVYPIYCNIHAKMVSYVISAPSRHVAHPDAEGRFTMPAVPEGRYRMHVWHERATTVVQELVVSATGATARATLDARGYVPGAHLNKFGVPYSTTRADRY